MKLEGIRVLDLSLFLPGPLLTQMMGDHGAEVIKLEPPAGEPNREIGAKRDGVTVYFANTHRGKKSVKLDLKAEEGREAALRLAETCDVMVEAFRPGVAKRLGVDYDSVAARNPGIVYCSLSAFGQTGPYVKRPAHDLATEALNGIVSVTLGPDGRPAMPGLAAGDMLASMMGLSGVLMALLRRQQTGRGDYIDLAMMDAAFACMPQAMGPVFAEKRPPVPDEERFWGGNAMYRLYETKDGKWIALGAAEMHFARNILTKLGRLDLIALCQPPPGPNQNPVREFLAETFRGRSQAEWIDWFADVDAAFAPVNDLRQACDDPQIRAREMIVEDARGHEHIGIPIKFRNEPGRMDFRAPALGEHSEQVLAGLGYSAEEIAAMREKGVF
ncbi:MAG TPA: CaiB/BaiF CoA-transferase family protein [Alphaproteobacteria bacterium]|nr:CaiB/BaiF CoA-transferase family protein [Alphaproteobacteria bacterium]